MLRLWSHLRAWWAQRRANTERRAFTLDAYLLDTLHALARQTGQSEDAIANDLLATGLQALSQRDHLWQCWHTLTPSPPPLQPRLPWLTRISSPQTSAHPRTADRLS